MNTNTETLLDVAGMSCQHCVQAVTRALQEADAAATVTVDLEQKTVTVDSAVLSEAQNRERIADEGYEPGALA